jgi:hypothetical protein
MTFDRPLRKPNPKITGYRCDCGNERLAVYRFAARVMRGMRWCDPCGRVVRRASPSDANAGASTA